MKNIIEEAFHELNCDNKRPIKTVKKSVNDKNLSEVNNEKLNNRKHLRQVLEYYVSTKKVEHPRPGRKHKFPFVDLWEQVYASLTDAGENTFYYIQGPLKGKSHYGVNAVRTLVDVKPGYDGIAIKNRPTLDYSIYLRSHPEEAEHWRENTKFDDFKWAQHIADVYGLEGEFKTDRYGDQTYIIYVPKNTPANLDLLQHLDEYDLDNYDPNEVFHKNDDYDEDEKYFDYAEDDDFDEDEDLEEELQTDIDGEIITEELPANFPVEILPENEIYTFIKNVPLATVNRPPVFFTVGYANDLTPKVAAKFRGGQGSKGQPDVKVYKCSEAIVYTGADYENLGATKRMRAAGKERGENVSGFNFEGEGCIPNKIGHYGNSPKLLLRAYPEKKHYPKVKYFISLDGEEIRETDKQEVAKYFTPGNANLLLNGKEAPEDPRLEGQGVRTYAFDKIYLIGDRGHSVF